LAVAVRIDESMVPGRIFLPLSVSSMPVNQIGTGVVNVSRLQEVHSI
jgi:hypothetical protein